MINTFFGYLEFSVMWRLIPVALAHVLLGAHLLFRFYQLDLPEWVYANVDRIVFVVVVSLGPLLLWPIRHRLVWWFEQAFLFVAGLEWIRIGVEVMQLRLAHDQPYLRASAIYVVVAIITLAMILLMRSRRVREFYRA